MRSLTSIGLALLSAALIAAPPAPPAVAYDICTDPADCASRAEANIAAGRDAEALDALVAEADLATGAGDKEHLRGALESLTAVNLKLGKPLMAHAWAQAVLVAFDKDAPALANLETAKQGLQGWTQPSSIAGTYDSYAGYGYWSELKIIEHDGGKVQTQWFMMRFGAVPSAWDYGPAAMWELSAEGQYANGNLTVTYPGNDGAACELTFKRTDLAIEWVSPKAEDLPQNCQTGGASVFPWGPFWLVDTAVPTFDDDSTEPDAGAESGSDEESPD